MNLKKIDIAEKLNGIIKTADQCIIRMIYAWLVSIQVPRLSKLRCNDNRFTLLRT